MTIDELLTELRSFGSTDNIDGMASYGITSKEVLGISMPRLKEYARSVKKKVTDRHDFAEELWKTGVYEARVIAYLIDDVTKVDEEQMERWSSDFDNWAIVDGTCSYLFCRTPLAYRKVVEWAESEEEFKKRAAFSLIAYLAVHDKKADDTKLTPFFSLMEKHAYDNRRFVKKAVNWALRQVGKRSESLHRDAIEAAERIRDQGSSSAKWIASDALRELNSDAVINRLREKESRKKLDG